MALTERWEAETGESTEPPGITNLISIRLGMTPCPRHSRGETQHPRLLSDYCKYLAADMCLHTHRQARIHRSHVHAQFWVTEVWGGERQKPEI